MTMTGKWKERNLRLRQSEHLTYVCQVENLQDYVIAQREVANHKSWGRWYDSLTERSLCFVGLGGFFHLTSTSVVSN
jgi:hypothetical protein